MAAPLTDDDDTAVESATTGSFRAAPTVRQRVADQVFESLARAILNGKLRPDEPLATQRDLAKQFDVSALVVRQAIHRLEDLSLVRVRQGSATIVLDPNESTDIRLIQLQMELSDPGPRLATAALENQMLFVLPLLVLAERRITEQDLAVLRYLTDCLGEDSTPEERVQFRLEYWRQIARATQNPLFQLQLRWWSTLVEELEQRGRDLRAPSPPPLLGFYANLTAALAARKGAVELYLESIGPVLKWLDAQRRLPEKPGGHAGR